VEYPVVNRFRIKERVLTMRESRLMLGGAAAAVLIVVLTGACAPAATAQDAAARAGRVEELRARLRQLEDEEAALRARLSRLDEDLKPENIQNRVALVGTLDATKLRDEVRRQLEGEKTRTQQLLDSVGESRNRIETAIATEEAQEAERKAAAPAPKQVETAAPAETTRPAASASPTPPRLATPARRPTTKRRRATRARRKN
jgi:cell division protein FtsB